MCGVFLFLSFSFLINRFHPSCFVGDSQDVGHRPWVRDYKVWSCNTISQRLLKDFSMEGVASRRHCLHISPSGKVEFGHVLGESPVFWPLESLCICTGAGTGVLALCLCLPFYPTEFSICANSVVMFNSSLAMRHTESFWKGYLNHIWQFSHYPSRTYWCFKKKKRKGWGRGSVVELLSSIGKAPRAVPSPGEGGEMGGRETAIKHPKCFECLKHWIRVLFLMNFVFIIHCFIGLEVIFLHKELIQVLK